MIKRILVGLGGQSFAAGEIEHAIDLAKIHNADVTGLTVLDTKRLENVGAIPLGGEESAKELREHRFRIATEGTNQVAAQFESHCGTAGIRCHMRRETGDPFKIMEDLSRYNDIVILGLRSIFNYGVDVEPHDSLAELIRRGVRPIFAVAEEYRPVRRVMMAYSGSLESAKAIRQFFHLQLWPDCHVRLVSYSHDPQTLDLLLKDMADYCRAYGIDPELHSSQDSPEEAILREARQWEADLIVMGNSSCGFFRRTFLGETVSNVAAKSDRALFLTQ